MHAQMKLVEIMMQAEAARATVEALGELGLVQFVDLNAHVTAYNRTFVKDLKRCDDIDKSLAYVRECCEFYKAPAASNPDAALVRSLDEIELRATELQQQLAQLRANGEVLQTSLNQLRELKFLLESSAGFFEEDARLALSGGAAVEPSDSRRLLEDIELGAASGGAGSVRFVAGLLPYDVKDLQRFQRILWRATRGNVFVRFSEDALGLPNAITGKEEAKVTFVAFFQGQRVEAKVVKIAEASGANVYNIPNQAAARRTLHGEVSARVADLDLTVGRTVEHARRMLVPILDDIPAWQKVVTREKAVLHELNKFRANVSSHAFVADAWIPVWAESQVTAALQAAVASSGAPVQSFMNDKTTRATKPTYYLLNKYTRGFQNIIDAYGVADYQEANPGVFTIITFPFLFGVMFGDIGHGILLTMFGALLVWKERQLAASNAPEMFWTIFNGRYLITLMGVFAIYAGLMYNDCFDLSIDFFGTNWRMPEGGVGSAVAINPARVYPFGHDPGWSGAANRLAFDNSIKMKLAIILGVCQMLFGIVLSLTNHIHRGNYLNIFCEFIPQVVFLLSMFGYMCFLICLKWVGNLADPPLVLGVIIDMFLKAGSLPPKNAMFAGQASVQSFLLIAMFICPPWMLLPKPIILYLRSKSSSHTREVATTALLAGEAHASQESDEAGAAGHGGDDDGEHGMGEIIIHQVIHTIEFVLGTVSNTASYLRLWALSLAHAQLSDVIWEQIFFRGLHSGNPVFIFVTFSMWAMATVGILMLMESLSSFLHALRLHWVEWMSKFYNGTKGVRFAPFILSEVNERLRDL